jgi:hypothetical protein
VGTDPSGVLLSACWRDGSIAVIIRHQAMAAPHQIIKGDVSDAASCQAIVARTVEPLGG